MAKTWQAYGGEDAYADCSVYDMGADDINACRQKCITMGCGGFAVYGGTAYFREQRPQDLRAARHTPWYCLAASLTPVLHIAPDEPMGTGQPSVVVAYGGAKVSVPKEYLQLKSEYFSRLFGHNRLDSSGPHELQDFPGGERAFRLAMAHFATPKGCSPQGEWPPKNAAEARDLLKAAAHLGAISLLSAAIRAPCLQGPARVAERAELATEVAGLGASFGDLHKTKLLQCVRYLAQGASRPMFSLSPLLLESVTLCLEMLHLHAQAPAPTPQSTDPAQAHLLAHSLFQRHQEYFEQCTDDFISLAQYINFDKVSRPLLWVFQCWRAGVEDHVGSLLRLASKVDWRDILNTHTCPAQLALLHQSDLDERCMLAAWEGGTHLHGEALHRWAERMPGIVRNDLAARVVVANDLLDAVGPHSADRIFDLCQILLQGAAAAHIQLSPSLLRVPEMALRVLELRRPSTPASPTPGVLEANHGFAMDLFRNNREHFRAFPERLGALLQYVDAAGPMQDPILLIAACAEAGLVVPACSVLGHHIGESSEWLAFVHLRPSLAEAALATEDLRAAAHSAGLLGALATWNALIYFEGERLRTLVGYLRCIVMNAGTPEARDRETTVANELVAHAMQAHDAERVMLLVRILFRGAASDQIALPRLLLEMPSVGLEMLQLCAAAPLPALSCTMRHAFAAELFATQESFCTSSEDVLQSLMLHIRDDARVSAAACCMLIGACGRMGLHSRARSLFVHNAALSPQWFSLLSDEPRLSLEVLNDGAFDCTFMSAGLSHVLSAWGGGAEALEGIQQNRQHVRDCLESWLHSMASRVNSDQAGWHEESHLHWGWGLPEVDVPELKAALDHAAGVPHAPEAGAATQLLYHLSIMSAGLINVDDYPLSALLALPASLPASCRETLVLRKAFLELRRAVAGDPAHFLQVAEQVWDRVNWTAAPEQLESAVAVVDEWLGALQLQADPTRSLAVKQQAAGLLLRLPLDCLRDLNTVLGTKLNIPTTVYIAVTAQQLAKRQHELQSEIRSLRSSTASQLVDVQSSLEAIGVSVQKVHSEQRADVQHLRLDVVGMASGVDSLIGRTDSLIGRTDGLQGEIGALHGKVDEMGVEIEQLHFVNVASSQQLQEFELDCDRPLQQRLD